MSENGVVVTGLGIVSPLGSDVEEFWTRLLAGDVGTRKITRFSTDAYRTDRGGEIPDFALKDHCVWSGEPLPRAAELFLASAAQAVSDSSLTGHGAARGVPLDRVGVVVGTVFGSRPHLAARVGEGDKKMVSRGSQVLARAPARQFGFAGPNVVLSTGCAAGNDALGQAWELIRSGRADAVVAGGAEELSEVVFALFTALRALAYDCVRPFDAERRGLMVAEGAAALVLEAASTASARGATPYAEVAGQASVADAHHITAPHPLGRGIATGTHRALSLAGLKPEDVDYVSAHGTGTRANDPVEVHALRTVFGGCSKGPAVSSIKGALGHSQGAASALEAVSCVLSIRDGAVPGSPTLRVVDPACQGVDLVRDTRTLDVNVVLSNAFGFGGSVSSLVLRRCPPTSAVI
jgi:3-oxoacyl-(acyl-carrier-protein) synthase